MSKLKLSASKEIWDETNPLPCVRIAFLSDFSDGNLLVDWGKWVDYVNECDPKSQWIVRDINWIDYEATLQCANRWVLLDFIEWL